MHSLPVPSPEAQAHSKRLRRLIAEAIAQNGGWIDFARFMELALYAPGLGYYSAGATKFGAAGDFVTAPEISPLFAHCLARQCVQVLSEIEGGDILECGAGSGVMAAALLAELDRLQSLPQHYFILERSAELRERQRERIAECVPHLLSRVVWWQRWPERPMRGVVLANELLDALPVHRVSFTEHGINEQGVFVDGEQLCWREQPLRESRLHEWAEGIGAQLPRPYISEKSLAAEDWLRSLATVLQQGVVLLIDYGFPAAEFYHAQRNDGTLMCHYRHYAHADPFYLPGLQDITAHVDFSALALVAQEQGMQVLGFTNQAHFLIDNGLDEAMAALAQPGNADYLRLAQQVKLLTMPSEMGELFKVLALGMGWQGEGLRGFASRNQTHRL